MNQPSFMAGYGGRLVDNGYSVIPIMPGSKVPGRYSGGEWSPYPDWTRHCDRPTKSFEVDIWRRWPGCGVGIAAGAVVGIDIDVLDGALAIQLAELAASIREGGRQSRSDITRRSQFLSRREREEIIASLIEAGLVVMEVEPGTTKPTAYYTATAPTGAAAVRSIQR